MGKFNSTKFIASIKSTIVSHSPEILTGIGIAGMIATSIMAVKATPKAIKLIEEKEKEVGDKLTPIETIKATWKCYIPATVTCVTSTACLIGASSVNARRNAALATAYSLSKTALSEYKDAVVETIGEKKEKVVRETVNKEKLEKNPVTSSEVINTERGTTLCYDGIFGRYFRSDRDTIIRAINKMNRQIVAGDMYVSLNEFYDELGLSHIEIGDRLGWNIDDGEIGVEFDSQLAADGTPCLVIHYTVEPKYEFSRYF